MNHFPDISHTLRLSTALAEKTATYVRTQLEGEGSGHDWWHVYRVLMSSQRIAKEEGDVDLEKVELGALLHDIADYKFHNGDETVGPRVAREWLESQRADEKIIESTCEIIQTISFKGAGVKTGMKTNEGMIVQDADRLDALGAIGIARTFAYGGYKEREMFNPTVPPVMHQDASSYKKNTSPTINHFYEKLFLLKDLMNTDTGRKLAQERHELMEEYLKHFYQEWEGKA